MVNILIFLNLYLLGFRQISTCPTLANQVPVSNVFSYLPTFVFYTFLWPFYLIIGYRLISGRIYMIKCGVKKINF